MANQNIIATAPPEFSHSATQSIYPKLDSGVDNFRLLKIDGCKTELENEISHYIKVCKKYKKAKAFTLATATVTGIISAILSPIGIATSLTGVGLIAGIPLFAVSSVLGVISSGFIIGGKMLNKKNLKHVKNVFR